MQGEETLKNLVTRLPLEREREKVRIKEVCLNLVQMNMYEFSKLNLEETAAAQLTLLGKRDRVYSPDDAAESSAKKSREDVNESSAINVETTVTASHCSLTNNRGQLKPYPYFYYKDYSTSPDPDPLIPLTPPGRYVAFDNHDPVPLTVYGFAHFSGFHVDTRVPNFVAKMHAILSRPNLTDVIVWMPHGRSFKILKPRDFEIRVLPVYFEHSKFSSFIRQANGWGFRRIT
jgi:hypothetical protein